MSLSKLKASFLMGLQTSQENDKIQVLSEALSLYVFSKTKHFGNLSFYKDATEYKGHNL